MKDIKVGDYLVCKNDYTFNPNNGPAFFKHKRYKVENIIFDFFSSGYTYNVEHQYDTYIINGYKISFYFLSVIFYTKKEERKIKLNNLLEK